MTINDTLSPYKVDIILSSEKLAKNIATTRSNRNQIT